MSRDEIYTRFIAELTRVIGAMLETSSSSRPAAPAVGDGFKVSIAPAVGEGQLFVYFARAGAEMLVKTMTAQSAEPSEGAVVENLTEVCSQALSALDSRLNNAMLAVQSVEGVDAVPELPAAAPIEIVLQGQGQAIHVTVDGDLAIVTTEAGPKDRTRTLDVILDIDLPLVVRFGRTELSLKTLTALGPGSVIDLGRTPDEPVEVLISNRVVARGDVVIVGGNYGVRVRDVVSPAERARTMEADLA